MVIKVNYIESKEDDGIIHTIGNIEKYEYDLFMNSGYQKELKENGYVYYNDYIDIIDTEVYDIPGNTDDKQDIALIDNYKLFLRELELEKLI